MILDPGGRYAILDRDTGIIYCSAVNYSQCLMDMPASKYKHLQNVGIYGHLTSEGVWVEGRLPDDSPGPSAAEKRLSTWAVVITFSILFLYWFLGQYLGWLY